LKSTSDSMAEKSGIRQNSLIETVGWSHLIERVLSRNADSHSLDDHQRRADSRSGLSRLYDANNRDFNVLFKHASALSFLIRSVENSLAERLGSAQSLNEAISLHALASLVCFIPLRPSD
jgi:hypothetical protein